MHDRPVSFGDNVRIRSTPITQELGVAGLMGQVYGTTTPSITGVEVIGEVTEDHAVAVHFKERGEEYWFVPELVEFIDHAPGTEVRMGGVPWKWVRSETGEWIMTPIEDTKSPDNQ